MKNLKNIKRIFAAAMVCAATFVGYNTYKQATMSEEERLMQANLDALSDDEVASFDDAIWEVTWTASVGTETKLEISCTTGGEYKCK